MFNWLTGKATRAAVIHCKLNIRLNTKRLISVANRANKNITASGGTINDDDIASAQKRLLADMLHGNSMGISIENIKNNVMDPLLHKLKVSNRAKIAVEHVYKSAVEKIKD
jgi:hypothetical protein